MCTASTFVLWCCMNQQQLPEQAETQTLANQGMRTRMIEPIDVDTAVVSCCCQICSSMSSMSSPSSAKTPEPPAAAAETPCDLLRRPVAMWVFSLRAWDRRLPCCRPRLLLWGCWAVAKLILPLEEATPSLCLQPVPLVAHDMTRNLVEHQAAI